MKTLYIDVYFLLNFTVDIIALYFASVLSKVPTTARRLILASVSGALSAVAYILSPEITAIKLLCAALGAFLMTFIGCKRVLFRRRCKFFLSFIIFGALIGGAVYFLYGLLDKSLVGEIGEVGGASNRRLLLFSLLVLLSIGVFKMIVSFFSNIESEGSIEVRIAFLGKTVCTEAFVDSGNLATDPMDMRPVLFLKECIARRLFPDELTELRDPDKLDREIRKRIRLIPITRGGTTQVLTGVKVDSVSVVRDGRTEDLAVTVAIDREGGNYGGFEALMPSAALGNA